MRPGSGSPELGVKLSYTDLTPAHVFDKLLHMNNNTPLQEQARSTIANADFRLAWPIDVR